MPNQPPRAHGSQPRRTSAPSEAQVTRSGEGNPFVEGARGISIVALVALAAVAIGGILAVLISLIY
ncbi:MAG: hypothetical protein ACI867_001854 [Glaciecola sp.]|jgi:hypothetical protein